MATIDVARDTPEDTAKVWGVSWYGDTASIAQTGFLFTRHDAIVVACKGAEADDFWKWANKQPYQIDELTDGAALPVVRADVETEDEGVTAWRA